MRAFDYHPLSKLTVKEKLLYGLTYPQTGWVALGLYLSSKMTGVVPRLSFISDYAILSRLHYFIPLGICCIFGFVEHPSGMTFPQYFVSYAKYKARKKVILDHRLD